MAECSGSPSSVSTMSGFVKRVNHWLADPLTDSDEDDEDMMSSSPSGGTGQSGHSGGSGQSGRSGSSGQSGSDERKSPESAGSETQPGGSPYLILDGVRPVGLQDPSHPFREEPIPEYPPDPRHQVPLAPGPQGPYQQVLPVGLQDPHHVPQDGLQHANHPLVPLRQEGPPNHQQPCIFHSFHQFGCVNGEACAYSHLGHMNQIQARVPRTRRSSARHRIRWRVARLLATADLYSVQAQLQQEAMQDYGARAMIRQHLSRAT
mmetsp:Transcript_79892/g.126054  ORF Transcript_79892/g.126054 Transcript_79892/m.126054 type:complete len:262 (+) Transcript_79892:60-845(+)